VNELVLRLPGERFSSRDGRSLRFIRLSGADHDCDALTSDRDDSRNRSGNGGSNRELIRERA
jgi:hypothetical protein